MPTLTELIVDLQELESEWKEVLDKDKKPSSSLALKTRAKLIEARRVIQSVYGRKIVPDDLPEGVIRSTL